MKNKKIYTDLKKVFISPYGAATISREDYECCMCALAACEMSDEQMQSIVDEINQSMAAEYNPYELGLLARYRGGACGMSQRDIDYADKMSEREFDFFETIATNKGMRYYEDMTDGECERINKIFEQVQREKEKENQKIFDELRRKYLRGE